MIHVGLMSYSHRVYGQLEISEIRQNSIELFITEIISRFQDATVLVIFWLFLKHLPSAIKTLLEASKNFADPLKVTKRLRQPGRTAGAYVRSFDKLQFCKNWETDV
jgi:hypothetical protein